MEDVPTFLDAPAVDVSRPPDDAYDGVAGAAQPPLITLDKVGFEYANGVEAIRDVSLTVPAGSITGIVGPSGCGKSTLLHAIARVLQPTRGTVVFRAPRSGDRHDMTMVFQRDTVLPWLTVRQNVEFFSSLSKHAPETRGRRLISGRARRRTREWKKEVSQRTTTLLGMAGLDDVGERYPYELSGGMRRRTAFLTAVAPLPELLLLDEPFSSVDEPTRVGIHQDVLDIVHRWQITVVLVTHDLAEAVSLCDAVYVLSKGPGRVVQRREIPFASPRDMLKLRETPEFLEAYAELWGALRAQIAASQ